MRGWSAGILVALASGCATPTYIARVNQDEVTAHDVHAEFKRRHGGHQSFLGEEPEVRRFVDKVVERKLLVQEAYRLGLDADPDIRQAVEALRTKKALEHLKKVELEEKPTPTPEEIQAVYDSRLEETYTVKQIVLPTRQEADEVRKLLEGGAEFDALARERSVAPTRIYGGNIPAVGWGALTPEWEATVFALKDGELSPPMETKDGFELVRMVTHNKVPKPELRAAAGKIKSILYRRKREQAKRELLAALWARYHVQVGAFERTAAALREAKASVTPLEVKAATWDGGQLTLRALAESVDLEALAALPPDRAAKQLGEQLENLVDPELLLLEADARGYGKLPEIVEEVNAQRDDLVEGKLYSDYLLKGIAVTDDEVRGYYDAHRAELVAPEQRHVAHIVVESEEKAAEVQKKLDEGERFEALVRPYSKDAETVKRAGDLGWVTKSQAVGDFAVVFDLPEGSTSKPVKSKYGLHVFKVLGVKPARPLAFDETRDDLQKKLLKEKREAKRADWVKKLRESSDVVVSTAGIRKFIADNPIGKKPETAPPSHKPGMEPGMEPGAMPELAMPGMPGMPQHGAAGGHGAPGGPSPYTPLVDPAPAPAAGPAPAAPAAPVAPAAAPASAGR